MTLFVDASALVALLSQEPESLRIEASLESDPDRITSALALWEAARALAKRGRGIAAQAYGDLQLYCSALAIRVVAIGASEASEAVMAHDRYGKGTGHPARLNMGDCFAYACAKANNARLLYKGDDFSHTDLA